MKLITIFTISMFAMNLSSTAVNAAGVKDSSGRIAAVVNDKSILKKDLDARVKLVTSGDRGAITPEIRKEILKMMIDESLQRGFAKQIDVVPDDGEIQQAYLSMEEQNGMAKGELDKYLKANGIPKKVLLEQISAGIGWRAYIGGRYSQLVQIGEGEVEREFSRAEADKKSDRVLLAEIVLTNDSSKPEDQKATEIKANKIVDQIRKGANFSMVAQQFSQSASSVRGGDIGAITLNQLNPELRKYVEQLEVGMMSKPIKTSDGYHIIYVRDKRAAGSKAEPDNVITFVQAFFTLPNGVNDPRAEKIYNSAVAVGRNSSSCEQLQKLTEQTNLGNAKIVKDANVKHLNPQLREILNKLPLNKATPPILSDNGFFMFMVSERKVVEEKQATKDDIRRDLIEQKLHLISQRELRNLRRAAFIDIRI